MPYSSMSVPSVSGRDANTPMTVACERFEYFMRATLPNRPSERLNAGWKLNV